MTRKSFIIAITIMGLFSFLKCSGAKNKAPQEGSAPAAASSPDIFTTEGGHTVAFEFYYHASLAIIVDNFRIYVDPVADESHSFKDKPKGQLLLFTHDHYDHFAPETTRELSDASTVIVGNAAVGEKIKGARVMRNGDTLKVGAVTIDAVPAYNTTHGHTQFHPKGRDNGYVLTIDSLRVYIAADTEDIPEMAQLKDIDIALLPCNQPFTMTPRQLVRAARMIKPKALYPYHQGDTDMSGIAEELPGIDVRIRDMR